MLLLVGHCEAWAQQSCPWDELLGAAGRGEEEEEEEHFHRHPGGWADQGFPSVGINKTGEAT